MKPKKEWKFYSAVRDLKSLTPRPRMVFWLPDYKSGRAVIRWIHVGAENFHPLRVCRDAKFLPRFSLVTPLI